MKSYYIAAFCIVATLSCLVTLGGQTVLSPGDIQILKIGLGEVVTPPPPPPPFCPRPPCEPFYFKSKVPLLPGTEIYFTDCGVKSDGSFTASSSVLGNEEGHLKYTVPTITYSGYIPFLLYRSDADSCWTPTEGVFWQHTTLPRGDQIICYQGSKESPTFITALNYYGTGWQAEATDENESTLPPGLTAGVDAFALDRTVFTGHIAYFDDPVSAAPVVPTSYKCNKTIHRGVWPPSIPPTGMGGIWTWNDISVWWQSNWDSVYDVTNWSMIIDNDIYEVQPLPVDRPLPPPYPWNDDPVELELVSYSDEVIIEWFLEDGWSGTCPVELSSFNAVVLSSDLVRILWITQSETEVSGYYILRNNLNDFSSAMVISPLINATNTSSEVQYSFTDDNVLPGEWYYWLQNIDYSGVTTCFGPVLANVEDNQPVAPPLEIRNVLHDAYPNPFSSSIGVTISASIKSDEIGIISIYNISGQLVRSYPMNNGDFRIQWDGKDAKGKKCADGIYLYKLATPTYSICKKMLIVD
jgi:hypothetical protein